MLPKDEVFATPWFRVVAKHWSPTAADDRYYALELCDYVVVVAVTEAGQWVLVRQFRPAVEQMTWELPAGTVDAGETPEQAARRELAEETGFRAESWQLLGVLTPDTGRLSNRMWCYCARPAELASERHSPEPGLEVHLATPAELAKLVAAGQFDHALHLAAVFLAQFHGTLPPLNALDQPGVP